MDFDKIKSKATEVVGNIKEKYNENPYDNPAIAEIAYPMDENIVKNMRFAYIDQVLSKPVEKLLAVQFGIKISQGIAVNENNYPEIYDILKDCCDKLQIDIPYTVIDSDPGMNAGTVGTDKKSYIMITNMLSEYLNLTQLKFILGHECGHISMKHMLFHTAIKLGVFAGQFIPVVGPYIGQFAGYPINSWSRCSEITADRLGLLCCQDLYAAQSALLKIIGGFKNIEKVNIDEYIANSEKVLIELNFGKYREYELDHPLIVKRLKAIELFYNSEVYYDALNMNYPADRKLLTKDELNKQTKKLLSI